MRQSLKQVESFGKHARQMATTGPPEDRAEWKRLADEADEHMRRELAEEQGELFVSERPVEPTVEEPGLF